MSITINAAGKSSTSTISHRIHQDGQPQTASNHLASLRTFGSLTLTTPMWSSISTTSSGYHQMTSTFLLVTVIVALIIALLVAALCYFRRSRKTDKSQMTTVLNPGDSSYALKCSTSSVDDVLVHKSSK
jgi:hypothetical protein